jgi:hypothetical protein
MSTDSDWDLFSKDVQMHRAYFGDVPFIPMNQRPPEEQGV